MNVDPVMAEAIGTIAMKMRQREPLPTIHQIIRRWKMGDEKARIVLERGIAMGWRKPMELLAAIPTTGIEGYKEWRR